MRWLNIEQRSVEWFNLRLGLFTSSDICSLFVKAKKAGELSKTAQTYITQKAIESIYPIQIDSFTNNAMQHGVDHEQDAVNCYEMVTDQEVNQGGFFHFDENTGSSPDGLIGSDGMVEIKCPYNRVNHLNNVLSLKDDTDLYKLSKQYFYQVHHQLFCSGRKWIDFCSFDPRLLDSKNFLHIVRIERNEELMDQMADVIYQAGKQRDSIINQFNQI